MSSRKVDNILIENETKNMPRYSITTHRKINS